jgi:hypothetical protein
MRRHARLDDRQPMIHTTFEGNMFMPLNPKPLNLAVCAAIASMGLLVSSSARAQLRVVNYNITASDGNLRAGVGTILAGIGAESVNGIAKPIDIMTVSETQAQATTTQAVANILNSLYGANTYAVGTLNGASSGSGTQGIIYRTAAVQLIAEKAVGTVSTSGPARQELRYQLRPVGYGPSADFYMYASHYKANNTGTDEARRGVEATQVRADADALGQGARIIYAGDFNTYSSSDTALVNLGSAGNGQAFDPISRPGSWHGSATFAAIFTQAPMASAPSGLVGGGIDDRFDLQYVTDEMRSGDGVAFIPGSYHTFAVNGSIPVGGSITDTSNTALPGVANRTSIFSALGSTSDHLPVVVAYQIPAKMAVSVAAVPAQVIVGADVPVNVTVTNVAPVQYSIGADALNYSVSGSGNLSGSGSGSLLALTPGNNHGLALSTGTPGISSGTVSALSTNVGVASGNFSQSVSTTVLSHAHPSFDADVDTASLTLDFGIHALDFDSPTRNFVLANRPDASGFTAALDLDSINGSGSTAALTTNAATFANLAAGGSNSFSAAMTTSAVGSFSASYNFGVSDQDLPGETSSSMILNLIGRVALGGDADLNNTVDLTDFTILASNFNTAQTDWTAGDFNNDGNVDLTDFTMLAANFNRTVTPANLGAAVPEPTTVALLTATAAFALRRRRI